MSICVHTLVRNEENYLWFAVASVAPFVDRVIIRDMASTDATPAICRALEEEFPARIDYKSVASGNAAVVTRMRREMLFETNEDWLLLVDGDEIWWDEAVAEVVNITKATVSDYLISNYLMLTGDMYHKLPENASKYSIAGRTGFINIRLMRRAAIDGVISDYPGEAYVNANGTKVQDSPKSIGLLPGVGYIHASHLNRTSSSASVLGRNGKRKLSLGVALENDFYYPEVLFRAVPGMVPFPWRRGSSRLFLSAIAADAARKIVRAT